MAVSAQVAISAETFAKMSTRSNEAVGERKSNGRPSCNASYWKGRDSGKLLLRELLEGFVNVVAWGTKI